MSFQAVLFDFDGTLADSYAAIAASINHVRAVKGLPPLTVPDVRRHVGRGPEYLLAQTVPGASFERDWPIYRAHHPSVMASHTHLLPGAAELAASVAWPYKLHLVLGLTIFLVFPFSRLVHIWSAPVGYLFRSYQVVRRRGASPIAGGRLRVRP